MSSEEPKKVGMAKTSDPGDNTSSIPKEPMLPWEAKRGFLWGIPATIWMFLRHPVKAYSAPSNNKTFDRAGFNIFVLFFAVLIMPLYDWSWAKFYGVLNWSFGMEATKEFSVVSFSTYFAYLDKMWYAFALIIGIASMASSLISYGLAKLILLDKLNVKLDHVSRIFCYAWSAYFWGLVPFGFGVLMTFGYLTLCLIGAKKIYRVSYKQAIFLGPVPVLMVYSYIISHYQVWFLIPQMIFGDFFSWIL